MNNDLRSVEVLDEYVEDTVAGRIPRAYQRMASALDIDVEALLELIPLFEVVTTVYESGRIRSFSSRRMFASGSEDGDMH